MTWCFRILAIGVYLGICKLLFAAESWSDGLPGILAFAFLPAGAAALLAVLGERRQVPDERVFGPAWLVVVLAATITIPGLVTRFSELAFSGIFGVAIQALIAVPLVLLALRVACRLQSPCAERPPDVGPTRGLYLTSPWQLGAITTYVVTHHLLATALPTAGPRLPTFGTVAIQLIVPAAFAGVVAIAGNQRHGARAPTALPNALFCVMAGALAVVAAYALQWRWFEALANYPNLLVWMALGIGLQVLCAAPLLLALDLMLASRDCKLSPS
ncbi:MAG: hypothetical protein IPK26_25800 [Planctomycetes bacterium]|nr:hypothetical protein [Planctomycetota bacterium]